MPDDGDWQCSSYWQRCCISDTVKINALQLQTRGAVAGAVDAMQLDAIEASNVSPQHLHVKRKLLYT